MDGSAFLTLPASLFRPLGALASQEGEGSVNGSIVDDDANTGLHDLPGIRVNGAALHNEGERRRKEILETASGLEERYRVLLPPDKVVKELTSASVGGSRRPSASVEPEAVGEEEVSAPPQLPQQKIKLRIKFPSQGSPVANGNGNGVIPGSTPGQSQTQVQAQTQKPDDSPRRVSTRGAGAVPTTPVLPTTRPTTRTVITSTPSVADMESPRPNKRPRRGAQTQEVEDEDFVDRDTGEVELPDAGPASASASHKSRPKPHYPHHTHTQPMGILMATALRSSSLGSRRTTQRIQRHLTAFGLKIHSEIEEIRDFEIPCWLKEERLEVLVGQEPDGEFGEFGGAGGFAESVNGHENSVRAGASELGGGSVAGGGSVLGGGEGVEGFGSQHGPGSLDVDVGSLVGVSASQPSEIVSTSEPAEMEISL